MALERPPSNKVTGTGKNMTVTFTLPISCQICLGKVKQPVLCSNLHVFCNMCLDVWLQRRSQCPTCKVEIGPDNPVRHVIGGRAEEEEPVKTNISELRKARFDLLYKEYEDELEQLKRDNIFLRTQNNILTGQVKAAESRQCQNPRTENDKSKESNSPGLDSNSLLQVTKNLQEAQKLYQSIAGELTQLKQENCKLKDENIQLTRENENLRLEIAQRSPKKFGRYTVATLETKIAEQDNEIRRLTKALERSDLYIEELSNKKVKILEKKSLPITTSDQVVSNDRPRFQINLEPKAHSNKKFLSPTSEEPKANSSVLIGSSTIKDVPPAINGPCRVLFGKVFPQEPETVKSDLSIYSAGVESNSAQSPLLLSSYLSPEHKLIGCNNTRELIQRGSGFCPPLTIGQAGSSQQQGLLEQATTTSQETLEKCAALTTAADDVPGSYSHSSNCFQTAPCLNTSDNLAKNLDNSSFNLELPSPIQTDFGVQVQQEVVSPTTEKPFDYLPLSRKGDLSQRTEPIIQAADHRNSSNTSNTSKKSNVFYKIPPAKRKKRSRKGRRNVAKMDQVQSQKMRQDINESSHLSLPDSELEANKITYLTDFTSDSDVTSEFSDCLKRLDMAEQNSLRLSQPSYLSPQNYSANVGSYPISQSLKSDDGLPVNSDWSELAASVSHNPPSSSISFHPLSTTYGNSITSWQQQFYNSVNVNPYQAPNSSQLQSVYPNSNPVSRSDKF